VATYTDSSTGFRSAGSTRCKVPLNIDLTERRSAMSPGTAVSLLWRSASDSSWCASLGNYRYTSGDVNYPAPDTFQLFSVLPFVPLPILYGPSPLTCITMAFHYVPQRYIHCVKFHLHLQWVLFAVCRKTLRTNYFSGHLLGLLMFY
jgi:hypothetical protein